MAYTPPIRSEYPVTTRVRYFRPFAAVMLRFFIVLWVIFTALRYWLSGKTWVWNLPDSLPTITLLIAPILLLIGNGFIRQHRIRYSMMCLACLLANLPDTDIARQYLPARNCTAASSNEAGVKILSWNTQFLGEKHPGAPLGETIFRTQADIVSLQEVHLTFHNVIVDHMAFALPTDAYKTVIRKGGLAIATNFPIRNNNANIRNTPHLWVDVGFPSGRTVRIINVHIPLHISLTFHPGDGDFFDFIRARHAIRARDFEMLRDIILSSPNPVMLMGDFNSTTAMQRFRDATAGLCDSISASLDLGGMTWGLSGINLWRPDYILVSGEFSVLSHNVLPMNSISDHGAVLVAVADPM